MGGKNALIIDSDADLDEAVAGTIQSGFSYNGQKCSALARLIVLASGLPCTVLRPTLMFGWFDRKHLGWLARFMRKVPVFPIPDEGRYLRQPLYVGDFCNTSRCLNSQRARSYGPLVTTHGGRV